MRRLLLAAVALAFADSSIVVLALPDILDEFGASVSSVVWVITAYNLAVAVFAIVAVAARRLRSDPARTARLGLALFTPASIACAAAPGLWPLVAFRAAQGAGGALLLVAALPLLGEPERAVPRWALAAAAGAVVGPAIGGALTQLFDWRAIFIAQAPVAAAALLAVRPVAEPPRLRQAPSAGRLAAQA